ncbi:bifunctional diguanylate cyclase/phosphodiesterase [Pleionea litopenaei]|uniref:cyclic-guanylate-specific phosphodiesterase n=1 Tax=Pleionea litopenaei TaxID=3070815 RepID=A0AA51RUV8_9GAMM|nr:EAL domain-containing protein [Pleionea sp. HL-JVS1]WMS87950.1 EAL domain-containing protein [Pleionea sp. HL-JVS1]
MSIVRIAAKNANTKQMLAHTEMLLKESQSIAQLGTWEWDITTGFLFWSDQIYRIFGVQKAKFEASYEGFLSFIHPDDVSLVQDAVNQAVENKAPYKIVHRIIQPEGKIIHVEERGKVYFDECNKPLKMIGTVQDITEKHLIQLAMEKANQTILKNKEQLNRLAYYDYLTELPNRNYFLQYLEERLAECSRTNTPFSLLFLDLDGFKEINDTQGHAEGDRVLKTVSEKLTSVLPQEAMISRLGGDEFAIFINNSLSQDIEHDIQHWLDALSFRKIYDGIEFNVTFSTGVVSYPNDGKSLSGLIKNADIAMYQAKALGKNQFRIFDPKLAERQELRIRLQTELDIALKEEQFEVYYQPKICLNSNTLLEAEALVRWKHPLRGLISPLEFIPLAEETGQIHELGAYVFRSTCQFINELNTTLDKPVRIAVNVSVKQLLKESITQDFFDIIDTVGIKPNQIELELTESAVMENIVEARKAISAFQNRGINIALDDFGTGYSSLSYLAKLTINTLKIDREFIKDIPESEESKAICRSIISLAHSLGKSVVAEGIETEEQLAFLKQLNCDIAQGYYFAKPMNKEDYINFCKTQKTES